MLFTRSTGFSVFRGCYRENWLPAIPEDPLKKRGKFPPHKEVRLGRAVAKHTSLCVVSAFFNSTLPQMLRVLF
jgi:hypothetical protein